MAHKIGGPKGRMPLRRAAAYMVQEHFRTDDFNYQEATCPWMEIFGVRRYLARDWVDADGVTNSLQRNH